MLFALSDAHAGVFVVTNTNDSGSGSLRYALTMCAASAGPHTIQFNIPTSDAGYNTQTGVWVIAPQSTFSIITRSNITIDGSTQTTNQGNTNQLGPEIVIDGGGTGDYGFRFMNAANISLKGLNIRGFTKGAQFYNAPHSTVSACYIGVNETADSIISNDIGLEFISGSDSCLIGGSSPADRNIISGNQHIGIRLLDVKYCTVSANYIGTNREGTMALPNYDGMSMEGAVQFCTIGGLTEGERNLISGNTDYGLPLFGVGATANIVIGNYIGTDATASYAIGNTYGVLFDDGSFGNRVGGHSDAERNIISGNVGYGVFFYNNGTNSNILRNNYIGTDCTGLHAIPNTAGIIIDGISYSNIMDSNIISGNLQSGIGINITGSDSNIIVRNLIGVNAIGQPLPNGLDGIRISQGPKATRIGGTPAEANIIANNGACGVYITNETCTENLISCNSFYNNGSLAIDLFQPGVTLNDDGDIDNGANRLLNFPEITSVTSSDGILLVSGSLDTPSPSSVEIQLYVAAVDNSAYGEGQTYLESLYPNADGYWSVSLSNVPPESYFTALSIDQDGNTSEFSRAVSLTGAAEPQDHDPDDPESIIQADSDAHLTLFPNPTSRQFQVIVSTNYDGKVFVYDIHGQLVAEACAINGMATVDLARCPSGIYIVKCAGTAHKLMKR